ncbi:hypothetical protein A5647_24320 [Mycobacterium sp. 1100029.7]|nr:hypothetical protein A5647_24320 [Mycobacterium sp. 1100029.7]
MLRSVENGDALVAPAEPGGGAVFKSVANGGGVVASAEPGGGAVFRSFENGGGVVASVENDGGGVVFGLGGGGGQRGPGAKEHKANKALRRKKNGELVLGEVDAVVPVIGDDGPQEVEPVQRPPSAPLPQMPRPPAPSNPRRTGSEQRTEVGR